jgi:monovalent cation:H+ antiporter-2, CPA2 family
VLFSVAVSAGLFSQEISSILVVVVTLTMALTPLTVALAPFVVSQPETEIMDEDFEGAGADVLMVGFSRFGQIVAQVLLTSGQKATIIDTSAERIRQAGKFGFRIYFGDGGRLDVLKSAGIAKAKIVAVCTNNREATDRVVDLIKAQFPNVKLFVRSYDRTHTISLRKRDVDYEIRETLESALVFGKHTLQALGHVEEAAEAIIEDVRKRDEERLELQMAGDIYSGSHKLHTEPVTPEPLIAPSRQGIRIDKAGDGFGDSVKNEPAL